MKPGDADRRLRKAFGLAVLVHVAALAALAHLPVARASDSSLEQLTVFDARARLTASPVTLVTLSPPDTSPAPLLIVAPPRPKQRPAPEAQPQRRPPQSTPRQSDLPRPARAPAPAPRPPAPERAVDPGGGGGGPANIGAPSPNGTVPPLGNLPGGGTPPGQVPGSGGGSGPGEGPGSGGGAGGGAGGGEGTGTGEGHGPGQPAPVEPSGHVSTTADQANPKVVRALQPVYPESAVADGVEGTVVMKVLVSERGEVLKAEVETSSGDRRLDKAALDAVRRWRYQPAVQDGKPRRVSTRAIVTFQLE